MNPIEFYRADLEIATKTNRDASHLRDRHFYDFLERVSFWSNRLRNEKDWKKNL